MTSTPNNFPHVKSFEELQNVELKFNSYDDVGKYVKLLNKGNPHWYKDWGGNGAWPCFVCRNCFTKNIGKTVSPEAEWYEITVRYKPWKSLWRDEHICIACYYMLQNPTFPFNCEDICGEDYGYLPSKITKYKKENKLYIKDLRDEAFEDPEFSNPLDN